MIPRGFEEVVALLIREQIADVAYGFPEVIVGSGGLYSTPKDLLRWMQWHLDRFDEKDAEVRMLDHAAYLVRDNLNPVSGMDESGRMDAMALGWVVKGAFPTHFGKTTARGILKM